MRRLFGALLACSLVLGCSALPVGAAENPPGILRISERFNTTLPANSITYMTDGISLAAGDTIKYDCTYSPKSASVDFGYVGPDGKFHYLNCTNGSINKTFEVSSTGIYTLAIWNNASYTVTVTGTLKY